MKAKPLREIFHRMPSWRWTVIRHTLCFLALLFGAFLLSRESAVGTLPPVRPERIPAARIQPQAPAVATRPEPARAKAADPFEDATVIAEREDRVEDLGPARGFERRRILGTEFKYPLILIRETVTRRPAEETGSGEAEEIAEAVSGRRVMVADHIIVKLKPGATEADLERLNARHGARVRRRMRSPGMCLVQLSRADLDAVEEAVTLYRTEAAVVACAEPDYMVRVVGAPDDANFSLLWGMNNTGQTGGKPDSDIDAVEAWDIHTGSRNVIVGIIDTGIDYNHEDLAANIWTNPGEIPDNGDDDDDGNGYIDDVRGWDFYNDDNDPFDDHYHGTHCAGTIGGVGNNGKGVAGVCWEVSLVGLKFLSGNGWGFTSDAVDAIYYATGIGCDLTSNSWGGGGYSQALKDAIDDAAANDILFVAAAGNNGVNADNFPMYPAAYTSDNIVSVAATDHKDKRASFSNYGLTSVDLGAPGVTIYSTVPGDGYGYLSGTSMATPHVAGVCALLKSIVPGMSYADVKTRIMTQTDAIPALAGKCVSGGRLNLQKVAMVSQDPVLIFYSNIADDAAGNGDGLINPGESIDLTVTLKNVGLDPAAGVNATLTTADENVTVIDGAAAFGNVPGFGGERTALDSFTISIDGACPTPRDVTLNWSISSSVSWAADGLWHESTHRSHSGLTSWYYGIENQWNYDTGATHSGSLTSGPIVLPGGAPSLSFRQWRKTEGARSTTPACSRSRPMAGRHGTRSTNRPSPARRGCR